MTTVDDIIQLMKKTGIAGSECDSLKPDQLLSDLDLDSYDWMRLMVEISDLQNEDVPSDVASRLRTLQDIVDYVNRQNN
jgi:acyl carrier protein